MSLKENDVFTDILLDNVKKIEVECVCEDGECEDTTEAVYEQEQEEKELSEWQYDNSQEPTCGEGFPTWDSER